MKYCISGIRKLKIALLFAFLLTFQFPLTAHSEVFDRSVSESIDFLMEHNRDLQKFRADWRIARLNVREAASAALPMVNLNGNYTRLGNIQSFEIDFDGDAPGSEPPLSLKTASENMYKGTISFQQQLFSGSIFGAIGVAKSYRNAADYTLQSQKNGLIRKYLIAYAQVQMLRDIHKLNSEMVDYTQSYYHETSLLHEIGAVDNYTLLRAEVEHLNSIPALKESERNLNGALSNLRLMLGLEPQVEIETYPFDIETELPGGLETLLEYAVEHRPELAGLAYVKEAYQRAVNVYRAGRWPTIAGYYNYERQSQWDMFSQTNLYNNTWNAGLTFNLPLFNGFRTSAQIQKGKLDLLKAGEDYSMLTDQVKIEVQLAYDDYQRSSSDFQAWFRNVDLAEEGFRIAQLRNASGDGSELELRDARIAMQSARTNLSRAKFDLIRAKIELMYAIGALDSIKIIEVEEG